MIRALVFLLVLAGCQMAGDTLDIAAPTALQGPAVEVTSLDPVALAPEPAPAALKTPGQIACERRGGSFVGLARTGMMTCQLPTRDAGKQCRRESDCEGQCLARSGTCAPASPMLGCQSVLQEDGRRVELCID